MRAIRHLVATAVSGLKPERVSVIDETGKLLADGAAQTDPLEGAGADERKAAYEKRLREQVEAIVSSVVGPGHARVEITADFDLNRITQTSDKFDPDGRVVRSSQTREESSSTSDRQGRRPGIGRQRTARRRQAAKRATGASDQNRKTEEIVNYEISRTTKTEVTEAGRVNRISAAVLVDGNYTKNDKGEVTYQPRAKEEIDRITALVRSAIGFDAKRGDQVEVVNLRFAETTPVPINEPTGWMSYLQFTKDDIMRIRRAGRDGAARPGRAAAGRASAGAPDRDARGRDGRRRGGRRGRSRHGRGCRLRSGCDPAAGSAPAAAPSPRRHSPPSGAANIAAMAGAQEAVAVSNRTSAMIDVAQVQGQVHAQSVEKVGELAEKNPHEAVSIIRNWLHEDAA